MPTLSSDAKQLEFYEDRGPKVVKTFARSSKQGNSRDTVPADSLADSYQVVDKDAGDPEKSLAFSGQPSETLSIDVSRYNSSSEAIAKEENGGHQVPARLEISPKTDDCVASSSLEHNDSGSVPIKEEVCLNVVQIADFLHYIVYRVLMLSCIHTVSKLEVLGLTQITSKLYLILLANRGGPK